MTVPVATKHELYRRWAQLRQQTLNPNSADYKWAGGLPVVGIHDFWRFVDFIENEIGPLPDYDYKIHRKNLNKGWVSGNIEWAKQTKVTKDQRRMIKIKIGKHTRNLTDWCEKFDISYWRSYRRYREGYKGREIFR